MHYWRRTFYFRRFKWENAFENSVEIFDEPLYCVIVNFPSHFQLKLCHWMDVFHAFKLSHPLHAFIYWSITMFAYAMIHASDRDFSTRSKASKSHLSDWCLLSHRILVLKEETCKSHATTLAVTISYTKSQCNFISTMVANAINSTRQTVMDSNGNDCVRPCIAFICPVFCHRHDMPIRVELNNLLNSIFALVTCSTICI